MSDFSVAGDYNIKTNTVEILESIIRRFGEAYDAGQKFRGLLDELGSAGGKLRGLKAQLQGVASVSLDPLVTNARAATTAFDEMAKSAKLAREAIEAAGGAGAGGLPGRPMPGSIPGNPPPAPGGTKPHPLTLGHAASSAMALGFDAQMYGEAVEAAFKPALDLAQTRQRLIAASGGSKEDADAAIKMARQQVAQYPGTNTEGNLEVYSILARLTQDPAKARQLAPTFLPIGVAAAAFHPEAGNYAKQIVDLANLGEFRGALVQEDPKTHKEIVSLDQVQKLGDLLLAGLTATLGDFDFKKALQFTRSAGTSGANIDSSEYPYLIPAIQAMGSARAGTGLQGMEQQFSAGRMSEAGANMLIQMGLIRGGGSAKSNPYLIPRGMGVYQMMPKALAEGQFEKIAFHPREFLQETLMPMVDKQLVKEYGKKFTGADASKRKVYESNELTTLASRIPGGTFMGELLRSMILGERDSIAVQRLEKSDTKGIMAQSPSVKIDSFKGSIDRLMGTLGGAPFQDGLKALDLLTKGVNGVAGLAERHPVQARAASSATADLGFGLVIGSILKWTAASIEKYAPKGLIGMTGKGIGGIGRGLGPVTAGMALWSGLEPLVDRVQAQADANNRTLAKIDAFLSRMSGGLLGDVYLDGQKVGKIVEPGVTSAQGKKVGQAMRATTSEPDGRMHPQVPGNSWGHSR